MFPQQKALWTQKYSFNQVWKAYLLCFFYRVHDYVVTKAMAQTGASDVTKTSEWVALIKEEA